VGDSRKILPVRDFVTFMLKNSPVKCSIDLYDDDCTSVSRRRRLDGGSARRHGLRRLRGRRR
jgi:hypothetical protein